MRLILFVLSLIPFCAVAQHVVQGRVVDDRTREPLAFVHVLADGMRQGGTTDINGRFSLSVPATETLLRFSYVGYAPLELMVQAGGPVVIEMRRVAVELSTVEILPGENPAHRIIKQVYAGRRTNDGLRNRSHRYTSYSKTIFTAAMDSAMLSDPERLAQLDSSDLGMIEWMEQHHLLMIESATRRAFIPPAGEKEEVLAMRVSGLQDPSLLGMAASTKTFSIYEPQIVLNEKTYLSPIGPGSTDRYLFIIEDTLYQGVDSVYIISYRPRTGRKFEGLKGVLYVNTDGYALQNVIAEPVERGQGFGIKLQQQFEKVGGQAWFPVQLNTFLYLDFVQLNSWKLMGVGRTYLRDIEVDAPVARKEVRGPELVVDRMAMRREDTHWQDLRPDPLDERELRTYHFMDSIGEEYKLDRKLKWLGHLSSGRVPLGIVDLRLDQIMRYNGYEGLRLGAGFATNDRVSRYFSLGGYAAYGFADREPKYGGDLVLRPRPGRELEIRLAYEDDVAESGGVAFHRHRPLFSSDGARMWFVDRMDRIERFSAGLAFRVNSSLKMWLGTERTDLRNTMGYQYVERLTDDITYRRSRFVAGGFSLGMRFAYREQIVRLPDRQITLPSRWPVLHVQAFRAAPGVWQGEEDLWRVNVMLEKTFRMRMIGDLSFRGMAGMAKADSPYPFLYNLRGTFNERARVAVNNTFETMRPNEFLADRYMAMHVRHSFGNLLFKGKKWRPVPVLVGNAVWGALDRPENHAGFAFTGLNDGFYECGIQLDNLLANRFTGFGAGAFVRLGGHRFSEPLENIALKLTIAMAR